MSSLEALPPNAAVVVPPPVLQKPSDVMADQAGRLTGDGGGKWNMNLPNVDELLAAKTKILG